MATTLGTVAEPTLTYYTKLDIFALVLKAGYTVAEAFMASTPRPSGNERGKYGKMVLIGDPAYRPFPQKALITKS